MVWGHGKNSLVYKDLHLFASHILFSVFVLKISKYLKILQFDWNIRIKNPLYIPYHRKFFRQSYSFETSVSFDFVVMFLFTIFTVWINNFSKESKVWLKYILILY
jgi:hypothetical protein